MNRVRLVFWTGFAIFGLGALLSINAGSLATNWQPLGEGAWGGTTDPRLALTYRTIGNHSCTVSRSSIAATRS
jgi:hypothetical protein